MGPSYGGIFRRIADDLNGGIPHRDSWHRDLLKAMKLALPGLRPPVISPETFAVLLEFLNFRHKLRHIYGFEPEPARISALESRYPGAYQRTRADLERFLRFVDRLSTLPPGT